MVQRALAVTVPPANGSVGVHCDRPVGSDSQPDSGDPDSERLVLTGVVQHDPHLPRGGGSGDRETDDGAVIVSRGIRGGSSASDGERLPAEPTTNRRSAESSTAGRLGPAGYRWAGRDC